MARAQPGRAGVVVILVCMNLSNIRALYRMTPVNHIWHVHLIPLKDFVPMLILRVVPIMSVGHVVPLLALVDHVQKLTPFPMQQ